jgi:hypothetical protein
MLSRRNLIGLPGYAAMGALGALAVGPRASSAAPASAGLEIRGNQLFSAGKPVRLVGVAMGDPILVRKGRPLDDYRVVAGDWEANVVRISAHPAHWRSDRDLLTKSLAADVGAARAAGLWVILDWHAIGFPGGYTQRPDPAWGLPQDAYESDLATAIEFWTEMARQFGADPGMIFELWNEPIVDDKLYVSTGEHWPQLKQTWLPLIEAIRRHSEAIVLASGDRFAHDLKRVAKSLIDDPRTAYAWHCYPQMDKGQPNRWPATLDGLPEVKPVFVTEWGFDRNDDISVRGTPTDFGKPFVETVLERYKMHSTAWVWSAQAGPQMFDAAGAETEFGKFVRGYLRKVAGARL